MDVHFFGVGKDQYNEYLDQIIDGQILPWTEDSESEGYPVWTDWEASQRDVYFLNRNGVVDTTFSITPYDPDNPDDYTYIINLILDLRNEEASNDGDNDDLFPKHFFFHQNYPNPFNPVTKIRFDLPEDADVRLAVYDVLGRQVAELVSGRVVSGFHEVVWDASDVSSGIYLCQLTTNKSLFTNKMILIK
ncbi:MAG: T9SS type A sorting domain-containing protein [Candidatus Marinimicrobia bacterium]|nr:T9SS type A sorting domain-containing protein [Candidatus Neomarinimicrobiota bacterium]